MLGFDTVATKSHHHQPVNATTLVLGWKLVTALGITIVIDLYSRAVVGWSVAETMHTVLVTSALAKAMSNLPQGSRPLFHSDRGCQYTSKEFRKLIALYGLPQSMSAKGYCYDKCRQRKLLRDPQARELP